MIAALQAGKATLDAIVNASISALDNITGLADANRLLANHHAEMQVIEGREENAQLLFLWVVEIRDV